MAVTIIPATFIKTTSYKHDDAAETSLVCGINMSTGVAIAEAYKVARNNAATRIFQETQFGKDDSISGIVYRDGTVRLYISSADANASGSTSAIRVVDIPGEFPPSSVASIGTIDTWLRSQFKAFMIGLRDLAAKFAV